MGRQATCYAEWPGGEGEVRAVLETRDLILRAPAKRKLAVATLKVVGVERGALIFAAADGRYVLHLGDAAAGWAAKIATPPPTLAARLGIAAATRVHVVEAVDDLELQAAIDCGVPSDAATADLGIAVVTDAVALDRAAAAGVAPLWLAYVKGAKSPLGDAVIRAAMREASWIDIKIASVSDRLTATKFVRRA